MSLDSLCRWQAQVSVHCAWRTHAHMRFTQCSILLHLMDICFLTCICLWQISQIQTRVFKVVGPGLVSTSPAFVSCSAIHPVGPHGRHAQKTVNRATTYGHTRRTLVPVNCTHKSVVTRFVDASRWNGNLAGHMGTWRTTLVVSN